MTTGLDACGLWVVVWCVDWPGLWAWTLVPQESRCTALIIIYHPPIHPHSCIHRQAPVRTAHRQRTARADARRAETAVSAADFIPIAGTDAVRDDARRCRARHGQAYCRCEAGQQRRETPECRQAALCCKPKPKPKPGIRAHTDCLMPGSQGCLGSCTCTYLTDYLGRRA